jgi:hypothetical protein
VTTPESTRRASELHTDVVALNPQPLPPAGDGLSIDFVALNPQPLRPGPPEAV